MTRTLLTWTIGAWLLACSSTTTIHMEKIGGDGGAAGEASTTGDEADTGGSRATADPTDDTNLADDTANTTVGRGGTSADADDRQ